MWVIKLIFGKIARLKLRTQLAGSFIATSLLILLLSTMFTYYGIMNILKTRAEQSAQKQFHQFEYNFRTFLNEVDKISKLMLLDSKVQDFLARKYTNEYEKVGVNKSLLSKLSEVLGSYEYIDSIYIFSEDGRILGVTASTNEYLEDPNKENEFFKSITYSLSKNEQLKLVWQGGKKSSDFDVYMNNDRKRNVNVISAVRGIKSLYQSIQSATLIINIKERMLTSIYNFVGDPSSNTYIVDSNNIVISDLDGYGIGAKSSVPAEITDDLSSGSFILKQNSKSKQVFYLRLGTPEWTIINEIDLNYYVRDILQMRYILLFMFAVCFIISLVLSLYWVFIITKPIKKITAAMKEVGKGSIGLTLAEAPENEFGMITRQFNEMSKDIADLINEKQLIEKEKRKQEIAALQLQINPHFLYNTLNTIKLMAVIINATNIIESITILGNMMRSIFKASSTMCTIEEEIDYLKNYIKIMNFRYGQGIKMTCEIPEELLKFRILRFILQPLVENAICHGLAGKNYFGNIHVELVEAGEDLLLTISDDGIGITEDRLKVINELLYNSTENCDQSLSGIGIKNVGHRIRLHFGDWYGIDVKSSIGEGTVITLRLPKQIDL